MKKVKLIKSGMNKPYTISPYGKGSDTLSGRYVPMTSEETAEFRESQANAKNAKERNKIIVNAVSTRIISWDAEDDDNPGVIAAINAANVAAIPPVFLDQLQLVITSYATSDEAEDDEKKSESRPG